MRKRGCFYFVTGITGSGKSEILQTYILSMATIFHTYKMSSAHIDRRLGVRLILAISKQLGEMDVRFGVIQISDVVLK